MRIKSPIFLIRYIRQLAYFVVMTAASLGAFPGHAAESTPKGVSQALCIAGVIGDSTIPGYEGCSLIVEYGQSLAPSGLAG